MFGNLTKAFSPGDFSKWATSQMCNFPRYNFPKVKLGFAATGGRALRLQEARGPNAIAKHTWEVATRVIAHLGLIGTWEST